MKDFLKYCLNLFLLMVFAYCFGYLIRSGLDLKPSYGNSIILGLPFSCICLILIDTKNDIFDIKEKLNKKDK